MNENIDTSQWLPRGTPVINPFRASKGDMDGVVDKHTGSITSVFTKDNSIARKLSELGFLEEFHISYGITYMDLKKSMYGHLNEKLNGVFISMLSDGSINSGHAAEMYDLVSKRIGLRATRQIEASLNNDWNKHQECLQAVVANVYRGFFESLVESMDEVIEEIKSNAKKTIA